MALDFAAGCVGGCAGVLAGQPLDTVKVRLQTQSGGKYRGIIHCTTSIIKKEGVHGLYKGMSSPLAGLAAINAIGFGVYGNALNMFDDKTAPFSQFVAGAMSGFAQTIICCPMELTKLRVQVNGESALFKSPLDCFVKTLKTQGVRGLYRGMLLTIVRDCPAFGTYFASYEMLVRRLSVDGKPESLSIGQLLFAGGIAGMLSWLVNYPTDVLKTRFQADGTDLKRVQYASMLACVRQTYAEGGYRVFFAGLGSALLRAFPTNAATFFAAEWTFRLYEMYFVEQQEELYGRTTVEDTVQEPRPYGVHRRIRPIFKPRSYEYAAPDASFVFGGIVWKIQ